ncbi:MAG: carboxypeptidase regulatory-like domain-containing protein [Saprospiraceae bacterium]|nr:carboxypeptidase regulatory-like domain-containing protein [Pyrinomonadaceae bacterium]
MANQGESKEMNDHKKLKAIFIFIFGLIMSTSLNASAQTLLINEVEIDPPSTTTDACQYVEIRGSNPGGTVPANTYFLSVNSDGANFGFANQAINIGGQVIGSNGTITAINTAVPCGSPVRTFPAGTTVFTYSSPLSLGVGSETYLLAQSPSNLFAGQDLDTDDDGIFNAALSITVIDGFGLIVNPEEEFVYGAAAGVVNISNSTSLDQPDAVTRFSGNFTTFAAAAFYYGELAVSPDETTEYVAPFSVNFPVGGALTPGAQNVPGGPVVTDVPVSGRVTAGGRGLYRAIVRITDSQGNSREFITSSFGYYRFNGVATGQTYIISVLSKRFEFTPRNVTVNEELANVDFIAN